ncbi:hypothetical protein [Nonomuraea sp. NPDC049141]|uniref:hypothetical protein n=1 Tax=Nonomuraea sp. NPDC049141 TaxID=3155500 RepID=UPI0033DAC1A0
MSASADYQRRAISDAVQVLTKRLREWAAEPPDQREDPEMFARRFMHDMNGHGWRLTPAGRIDPWRLAATPADGPNAAYLAARAQLHPDQEGQQE